jgi:hypothetical protein
MKSLIPSQELLDVNAQAKGKYAGANELISESYNFGS